MCTENRPTAWDRNVSLTITTRNPDVFRDEVVPYRVLFAALALAETSAGVHVAHRAIEQNVVEGGFDLAMAAFGSIHDDHHIVLEPKELELAARLAYYLREGIDWLDAEGNEPT